ncbi:MAG TPA: hypothetical protein VG323_00160 [Thermoanaerobaculia bacterium]|nr:hypothetical protein [Thermoanaerobaculia bacterium]
MSRRPWLLYPAWIVLCAVLFLALRGANDPSRPRGRVLSNDAGRIAAAVVQKQYRGYEAVHVALSDDHRRWVVLCDAVPHSALKRAVVVELDASDGKLLNVRKPIN